MCFSAGASFAAATVLGTIGFFSIRKVESRSQFVFAAIPFLFAVQQLIEGIFWLTAGGTVSSRWEAPSVMIFLVFAQVVWPAWVPLSVYLTETVIPRRRSLAAFLTVGVTLALYHLWCLFVFPVHAEVNGQHVEYSVNFPPVGKNITGAFYVMVTVVPLFISSVKRVNVLGLTIFLSFVVTFYFYREHLISVWCFFAAVISGIVLWILSERAATAQSLLEKETVI